MADAAFRRQRRVRLPSRLPLAAAFATTSLGQIASETIHRLDLQTELPRETPLPSFQIPPAVFWGAVILAAAILVYFIVREVSGHLMPARRGGWDEADGTAQPTAGSEGAAATVAADALAREGRFVEAMHELLLQSLAAIRRWRGAEIADSLTSREILRRVPLSEAARSPLGDLVARVEWSYFGRHPAGPAEYQSCRLSFDRLRAALAGEAAA